MEDDTRDAMPSEAEQLSELAEAASADTLLAIVQDMMNHDDDRVAYAAMDTAREHLID